MPVFGHSDILHSALYLVGGRPAGHDAGLPETPYTEGKRLRTLVGNCLSRGTELSLPLNLYATEGSKKDFF